MGAEGSQRRDHMSTQELHAVHGTCDAPELGRESERNELRNWECSGAHAKTDPEIDGDNGTCVEVHEYVFIVPISQAEKVAEDVVRGQRRQ